jgi:hypothetical protein
MNNLKLKLKLNLKLSTEEKMRKGSFKTDLVGERFSRLVVKEHIENKPGIGSVWKCLCDCTNTRIATRADLLNGWVKSCGCFAAENRVAIKNRGRVSNNPKWRGGLKERLWSEAVKKRDNYTCQGPGPHNGELIAHHLKDWNTIPELRFVLENGLTVCRACHQKAEKVSRKIGQEFKTKKIFQEGFDAGKATKRKKIKIRINRDGKMTFIYDDALAALANLPDATITRVSHVEPCDGGWEARMLGIVGEQVTLGPFPLREQALQAEKKYLEQRLFT